MKTILVVFGTRPEIIKLFPVIRQLRKFNYNVILCNTEQQKELSRQALRLFGLEPDYHLSVMKNNQSLANTQANVLKKLEIILEQNSFDAVIVQGDTLSAFCGALAGFYKHLPVFHIEAGLRTHDIKEPFPEEAYRKMISCISTLHFAPSVQAKRNLIREGISKNTIFVTGNTIVDTLKYYQQNLQHLSEQKLQQKNIIPDKKNVLITIHRRENHTKIKQILSGIKKLSRNFRQYRYIILLHPNPNVKQVIRQEFANVKNIFLIEPLNYDELIGLMCQCALIMTDSGGIQEEAAYLSIPTVILRNKTERQEILKFPHIRLAGTDSNDVYDTASEFLKISLKSQVKKCTVYGTGYAAEKIGREISLFLLLSGEMICGFPNNIKKIDLPQ